MTIRTSHTLKAQNREHLMLPCVTTQKSAPSTYTTPLPSAIKTAPPPSPPCTTPYPISS